MWLILSSFVLILIAAFPPTPSYIAFPSLLAAGIILLMWPPKVQEPSINLVELFDLDGECDCTGCHGACGGSIGGPGINGCVGGGEDTAGRRCNGNNGCNGQTDFDDWFA